MRFLDDCKVHKDTLVREINARGGGWRGREGPLRDRGPTGVVRTGEGTLSRDLPEVRTSFAIAVLPTPFHFFRIHTYINFFTIRLGSDSPTAGDVATDGNGSRRGSLSRNRKLTPAVTNLPPLSVSSIKVELRGDGAATMRSSVYAHIEATDHDDMKF